MNITRISVYQVDVPIKPATISHSRVMSVFDETRGRPVCRTRFPASQRGFPCFAALAAHGEMGAN